MFIFQFFQSLLTVSHLRIFRQTLFKNTSRPAPFSLVHVCIAPVQIRIFQILHDVGSYFFIPGQFQLHNRLFGNLVPFSPAPVHIGPGIIKPALIRSAPVDLITILGKALRNDFNFFNCFCSTGCYLPNSCRAFTKLAIIRFRVFWGILPN